MLNVSKAIRKIKNGKWENLHMEMEKKKRAIFSDSTASLVLYSVLADWIIFTVMLYNILYQ